MTSVSVRGGDVDEQLDHWAKRITDAWRGSVEAIIETGRALQDAKDDLPDGAFIRMIRESLPFGERTAQRLMAIARDQRLADATFTSHLPPSWVLLDEIRKCSDDELRAAFKQEIIRPEMELKEIRDFRQSWKRQAEGKPVDDPKVPQREQAISWRDASDAELLDGMRIGAAAGLLAVAADVSFAELVRGDRAREVVPPRTIALYLANQCFNASQTLLGGLFGMDRTNIHHGVRGITDEREENEQFNERLTRFEAFLERIFASAA